MPNRILGHWGTESVDLTGTFQFSTGQYGIYVIGKACVCFTPSFSEVSPKLYITSVYLLHHSLASGMSGTGHPHECFEAVIKHCHMPTWASLSTFHILLRAIMYGSQNQAIQVCTHALLQNVAVRRSVPIHLRLLVFSLFFRLHSTDYRPTCGVPLSGS